MVQKLRMMVNQSSKITSYIACFALGCACVNLSFDPVFSLHVRFKDSVIYPVSRHVRIKDHGRNMKQGQEVVVYLKRKKSRESQCVLNSSSLSK